MKKIRVYVQILAAGLYTLAALPALAIEFPIVEPVSKDTELTTIMTSVANWAFTIAGGLAVLFLIYGGIKYITGGAKAEEEAKKIIMNAIIGLIVMALAYALAQFAINVVHSTL